MPDVSRLAEGGREARDLIWFRARPGRSPSPTGSAGSPSPRRRSRTPASRPRRRARRCAFASGRPVEPGDTKFTFAPRGRLGVMPQWPAAADHVDRRDVVALDHQVRHADHRIAHPGARTARAEAQRGRSPRRPVGGRSPDPIADSWRTRVRSRSRSRARPASRSPAPRPAASCTAWRCRRTRPASRPRSGRSAGSAADADGSRNTMPSAPTPVPRAHTR